MHILAFFASFSPYFRSITNISYNKKTQKPLYFLRFRALPFFSIKTDNALILYILISLIYAVFFAMTEKMDSHFHGNDNGGMGMTEGKVCKTCGKIASWKPYIIRVLANNHYKCLYLHNFKKRYFTPQKSHFFV